MEWPGFTYWEWSFPRWEDTISWQFWRLSYPHQFPACTYMILDYCKFTDYKLETLFTSLLNQTMSQAMWYPSFLLFSRPKIVLNLQSSSWEHRDDFSGLKRKFQWRLNTKNSTNKLKPFHLMTFCFCGGSNSKH